MENDLPIYASSQEQQLDEAVKEGVRRIKDIATGRVQPLTEAQYHAALLQPID